MVVAWVRASLARSCPLAACSCALTPWGLISPGPGQRSDWNCPILVLEVQKEKVVFGRKRIKTGEILITNKMRNQHI